MSYEDDIITKNELQLCYQSYLDGIHQHIMDRVNYEQYKQHNIDCCEKSLIRIIELLFDIKRYATYSSDFPNATLYVCKFLGKTQFTTDLLKHCDDSICEQNWNGTFNAYYQDPWLQTNYVLQSIINNLEKRLDDVKKRHEQQDAMMMKNVREIEQSRFL